MKCLKAYFILMFYPYFIKRDKKAKMKNKKYKKITDCQRQSVLYLIKLYQSSKFSLRAASCSASLSARMSASSAII